MDAYERNLPYEKMLATSRKALADVNAEIAKLETLREVWEKGIKWNEDKIKERDSEVR